MKTRMHSLLFIGAFIVSYLNAQQLYTVKENSKLTVEGTSSLHGFTLSSDSITGNVALDSRGEGIILNKISIAVPVKALHSGEDGMDKNMYEAMNADSHRLITFESSSSADGMLNDSGTAELRVKGTVTINGVQKKITMTVTAKNINGKGYSFIGSQKLLMTDFSIDPPSMFFGTIKTGDEVTVHFSVNVDNVAQGQRAGL